MEVPVCLSWSGQQFTYRAATDATVADLQAFIEHRTTIPPAEQITLFGPPFKNANRRSIASVLRGKKVFIYDRKSLSSRQTSVVSVVLEPRSLSLPSREALAPSSLRELAEAGDPLLRALAEYERKFLHHLNVVEVLQTGAASRLTACVQCLAEQRRILEALHAAQSNLRDNDEAQNSSFSSLWTKVKNEHRKNSRTLGSFESKLQQTAQVTLHEALQRPDRQTLYDWLPADRLRQWCQQCANYEAIIWKKTTELRQRFSDTSLSVAKELHKVSPAPLTEWPSGASPSSPSQAHMLGLLFGSEKDIKSEIEKAREVQQRQKTIAETVGANYRMVLEKVTQAQQNYKRKQQGETSGISSVTDGDGAQSTLEMCRSFDQLSQHHESVLLVSIPTEN